METTPETFRENCHDLNGQVLETGKTRHIMIGKGLTKQYEIMCTANEEKMWERE